MTEFIIYYNAESVAARHYGQVNIYMHVCVLLRYSQQGESSSSGGDERVEVFLGDLDVHQCRCWL